MASITTELVETGAKRDERGRKITTPAERVALIAQYRDSGLTQKAFARREGIKYSTFTTWVQGRRCAGKPGRKVHFAEVPMASQLPVMGGLEMIEKLRLNPEYSHIPIVVISTESSQSRISEIISHGIHFIHKPFRPEAVKEIILEYFGGHLNASE